MAGLNEEWSHRTLKIVEQQRGHFVMILDASLILVWLGDGAKALVGWNSLALGKSAFDLVHPNDLHVLMRGIDQQRVRPASSDKSLQVVEGLQARLLAEDGTWVWCELQAFTHLPDPELPAAGFTVRPLGPASGLEQVAHQLGGPVALDQVLASLNLFLDQRFGRGHASMLIGARWISGTLTEEILPISSVYRFLYHGDVRLLSIADDDQDVVQFVRSADAASAWIAPITLPESRHTVGAVVYLSEVVDPTFDQFRNALHTVARLAGIAVQLHTGKAELVELLTSDPVTGTLHARRLQDLVVQDHMAAVRVNVNLAAASAITYGSAFGDYFLMEVTRRIHAAVRPGDLITRLGQNEFVALLPNIISRGEVERAAARIRASLERPLSVAGRLVETDVSIGVDLRRGTEPLEDMVRRAEQQLNAAAQVTTS